MVNRLEQYDVFDVPLSEIIVDEDFNCRSWFTSESIESLADSIKDRGLDYPVTCNQDKHLVTGFRRYRACELLGLTSIPAFIRNLTERESVLLNVTENLERKNLNMFEEAIALKHLYPNGGTLTHMSSEIGKNLMWVRTRWMLLTLPEKIQQYAAAGVLSDNDLRRMLKKEITPDEQLKLCTILVDAKKTGRLPKQFKGGTRSKNQISRMIVEMLTAGIDGLPTMALSWCSGEVPDCDLMTEIRRVQKHKIRSRQNGRI